MLVRGSDEEGRVMWQCGVCNLGKQSKCNMRAHIETKHVHGIFHICPHCGVKFKTRSSLGVHLRRFHLGTQAGMLAPVAITMLAENQVENEHENHGQFE